MLDGCTTADPVKYTSLQSSSQLSPKEKGEFKYQYTASDADFSKYKSAIIDPVEIYHGDDAQFGDTSGKDQRYIADYIDKIFPKEISRDYNLVQSPGPDTLRFHITLTGVKKSIPVLSTLSHLSSVGLVANAGLQAAGENGTAYGAVYYAVEVYDAATSRLLYAHVTLQTPDALDFTASFGYLDAAREGVRIGAHHLIRKMESLSKKPATNIQESTGSIGNLK
ncbi:DUF3313 domain-containing protein [Acetobacter sp.]|jgi:hypothetical protein|uniref:DUF3313 domain-containing protein n=1 Tax=Acetobacter sp. TaxID=440 RepID=UPI0025C065E8|nr:DUF3313 domain-containing protein [Acetobacter sp.]MCH4091872.1 DUF3313 domain-containing protein [Acetobacter sp.]